METGDIDTVENCNLKCCDDKDLCCFMSISEQMERFIKNENNLDRNALMESTQMGYTLILQTQKYYQINPF